MKIQAKKSLGQNWLTSPQALHAMVTAAQLKAGEIVLEVGPGQGVLTTELLAAEAKVVAVEKDGRLKDILIEKFSDEIKAKKLKLLAGDILELTAKDLDLKNQKYKIVANLPYYITGQFLRRWLEEKVQPTQIVLMLQKEVAERIVAKDGKESLLSLAVKFYGNPRIAVRVPRGAFRPIPKVDSAVISIEKVGHENEKIISAEKFFDFIHRGFSHPRKNLKNNLREESWRLEICGISPMERPANLKLDQWLCLASAKK